MAPSIAIEKAAGSRACSEAQLRVKFEPGISRQYQLRQQLRNAIALSAVRQLIMELRADRATSPPSKLTTSMTAQPQQRREVARQADTQPRPEDQNAKSNDADGGIANVNGR